ncbi:hypothetical protein NA57DRAFT_60728 [Rhizodiscina lignyota]|uniref:BTB domain-containing protein n=1 Tax=Rhizodiscina lignyota TaxID=1504668 RepID=A0A9P4I7Z6_9PEZI|nr:hypothetical protein NA57DRAFT_60728 [Rhizodiscina lignyota]
MSASIDPRMLERAEFLCTSGSTMVYLEIHSRNSGGPQASPSPTIKAEVPSPTPPSPPSEDKTDDEVEIFTLGVHPALLSHYSGWFRKMLVKRPPRSPDNLEVTSYSFRVWQILVNWLYTGAFMHPEVNKTSSSCKSGSFCNISYVDLLDLYVVARDYDMPILLNEASLRFQLREEKIEKKYGLGFIEYAFQELGEDDPMVRHITLSSALRLGSAYSKLHDSTLPRKFLTDILEIQNQGTLGEKRREAYRFCDFHSHTSDAERDDCKQLQLRWCKEFGLPSIGRNSYTSKRKYDAAR